MDLADVVNVKDQMQEDDIPWQRVSVHLRRWALDESDVQRVVLGYDDNKFYLLAVLLNPFSKEGMEKVTEQSEIIEKKFFGEKIVLSYHLGPNQADSILLNCPGYHEIYRKKE